MMKLTKIFTLPFFCLSLLIITSCDPNDTSLPSTSTTEPVEGPYWEYEEASFVDVFGEKTNYEAHDYDNVIVQPLDNSLREDFAFGVDASMVDQVEKQGGVYFNKDGKEQDVFQILRRNGVNFLRLRHWNKPTDKYGRAYGGGDNDFKTNLRLAKRAKAANMNVMIDFHYSDFWADPDTQWIPKDWGMYDLSEIPGAIEDYTKDVLTRFKDEGVVIDSVQIGNEINNGMCGYDIDWNNLEPSFDQMALFLKAGIKGTKEVFEDARTVIHLANGGNTAEFETFFVAMDNRGVDYDVIGASYYPFLAVSLEDVLENLNNVSKKTNKPVIIAEVSWGFTTAYNAYTANTYSASYEDLGGYLTSEQAQATCIRDVVNLLANVDDSKGLGIFYWEPAWLPVEGAGWATARGQSYKYYGNDERSASYSDGLATWSNQALFSYTGKALASLATYKHIAEGGKNAVIEVSTKARSTTLKITLNLADHEKLPSEARVETNLDALRNKPIIWDEDSIELVKTKGSNKICNGILDGQYAISAVVDCIENFVKDPGFEKQGPTDAILEPWIVKSHTPIEDKVIKLDRKSDFRSGKTNLNWYHSSSEFTFDISQTILNLPSGNYRLTTYIMSVAISDLAHTKLNLYIIVNDGTPMTLDLAKSTYLKGWSAGYQECTISNISISEGSKVEIGLEGAAVAKTWAHNDDWELVNEE